MQHNIGLIKQILRFPVKSMGGEFLDTTFVDENGVEGDRIFALKELETGFIVSAKNPKKWKAIIELEAFLENEKIKIRQIKTGQVFDNENDIINLIEKLTARKVSLVSNSNQQEIREADRSPIEQTGSIINQKPLASASKVGHFFDFAPIHLMTTSSLNEIKKHYPKGKFDIERFRPNLLIDTGNKTGFVENEWLGKTLQIGTDLQIKIIEPCPRCVVTTLKQGELEKDHEILKTIVQHNQVESHTYYPGTLFKGVLGVYGIIEKSGEIIRGDDVVITR